MTSVEIKNQNNNREGRSCTPRVPPSNPPRDTDVSRSGILAPSKRLSYSEDAVQAAVSAVKEKKLSFREASKQYNVPKLSKIGLRGFHLSTFGKSDKQKGPCKELWHPGFDARYPEMNQTKRCWQNYVDYMRCQIKFGEDYEPCEYFKKTYEYLCPAFWIEKWDEQVDKGNFPMPKWA